MQTIRGMLVTAFAVVIGCGRLEAAETGCSSTIEISGNLRLVKAEMDARSRLEQISAISDCLKRRAKSGTIGGVGNSVINQLIDLLNDREDGVRGQSALALGWFGHRAKRAIPALNRAYSKIEHEISQMEMIPAAASDADIIAALERITGKPGDQLELPPIPDDPK